MPIWMTMNKITILLPNTYHHGVSDRFFIEEEGEKAQSLSIQEIIHLEKETKYICHMENEFEIGNQAWIIDGNGGRTDLQIGSVIRTKEFDQKFFYDGKDLGVTFSSEKAVFKLWAPTAAIVKVKLTSPPDNETKEYVMERNKKGVWSIEIPGNLEGSQYSYLLKY